MIENHTFTTEFTINSFRQNSDINIKSETFSSVPSDVISKPVVKKIASSGLELSHLRLTYQHGNGEDVEQLLSEELSNGKPRVTKKKRIIRINRFIF